MFDKVENIGVQWQIIPDGDEFQESMLQTNKFDIFTWKPGSNDTPYDTVSTLYTPRDNQPIYQVFDIYQVNDGTNDIFIALDSFGVVFDKVENIEGQWQVFDALSKIKD